VTDHSSLLVYQLAAREHSEVWNSTNVESSRQSLLLVGIHLEDDGMAGHIAGSLRNFGSGSPAWPAPLGPEIYQDRNTRALNDLIEQLIVRLKRLIAWGQLSFASSATASVRKVLRANSIFLSALFAASNDRHSHLPKIISEFDHPSR
jgi:hypothetical protein